MKDRVRAELVRQQEIAVYTLQQELQTYIDLGDEYHAALVRVELIAAQSPARLIHAA